MLSAEPMTLGRCWALADQTLNSGPGGSASQHSCAAEASRPQRRTRALTQRIFAAIKCKGEDANCLHFGHLHFPWIQLQSKEATGDAALNRPLRLVRPLTRPASTSSGGLCEVLR